MTAINSSQFSPEAAAHPSPGFQAIILCGPGTSLYPFTGAEDLLPKALLPIANKPMIHYSLEWCEKAGFRSILILTLAEHLAVIQSYIRSHIFPFTAQVEAPSSLDDNLGTADVLRRAYRHGWITGDIVVLPCDLVTDLDPEEVVKIWMVENAGFDSDMGDRSRSSVNAREYDGRRGGLGVWYETKGGSAFKGQETDFLALAPHTEPSVGSNPESQYSGTLKTLLYNLPGLAIKEEEGITLRKSFLRKFRNFKLSSTRRDSGIYFFPFWVLKFIDKNPKMSSVREDVLPWWSKARWQNKRLAERLRLLDILSGIDILDRRDNIGEMSTTRKRGAGKWTHKDDKEIYPVYSAFDLEVMAKHKRGIVVFREQEQLLIAPKLDTSSTTAMLPPRDIKIPPMTVYLPDTTTAFICRVDTIQLYLSVSLYLASSASPSTQIKVHPSASIDQKAHVNRSDCLIASKVTIAERAVVKRCVVGHGVSVARGARLLGCVLMDGASVAESASLEGCIVGRNALIGAEAKLKDCQVSQGFLVEPEMQAKDEIFIAFAGLEDDDNAPVTSRLELEGAYEYKEDTSQENQEQHVLDKSCSAIKQTNVKREGGRDGLWGMQTDILTAPIFPTEMTTQKAMEVEFKTHKDSCGNEDREKQNDKDQKVAKGQKSDETWRGKDETAKTSNKLDQTDIEDQGGKDQKRDEHHQMECTDETAKTNYKPYQADYSMEDQEVYLPVKSNLVYIDNRWDSSETGFLNREAATKQEETGTSPITCMARATGVEAVPEMAPEMALVRPPSLVRTWGLSVLTLGIWFAVFTAIFAIIERSGNAFQSS